MNCFDDAWRANHRRAPRENIIANLIIGEHMKPGYFIMGATALLVLVLGIKMYPDFARYMKMRSM